MALEVENDALSRGDIVFQKYRIVDLLGEGTFGLVYKAKHIETRERVAVKVASPKAPVSLLQTEYNLYHVLELEDVDAIPKVYEIGQIQNRPAIVMERLGLSLQQMFMCCQNRFQPATVAKLAVQMIERLAWFHRITGYVHRDVKPANFVLGFGPKRNVVYLIDYGLAVPYFDWSAKRHIPACAGPYRLAGTMKYASCNALRGHAVSRRDDLESLGYSLVYFMRGSLPWDTTQAVTHIQQFEKIAEQKMSISIQQLCAGLPHQFAAVFEHCKELGYTIEPDYDGLIAKFRHLCQRQSGGPIYNETLFEWTTFGVITKRTKTKKCNKSVRNRTNTNKDKMK